MKKPESIRTSETYAFFHQGEVQETIINVHIDYQNGHINLVEFKPHSPESAEAKKYVFTKRGLEYMQGWQDVFDALKAATKDATKRLQDHQAMTAKIAENELIKSLAK